VPWLEPDVADHLSSLADAGTKAVIVCPIGFVADHIEVVWDLDNELRLQAEASGIAFARARTPNADRRFARLAVDLIDELRRGREPVRSESPEGPDAPPLQGFSINGAVCTPDCG
jgi:ferrochelatase